MTNVFQTSSASAGDAGERISSLVKEVELECGDISASQEELLARTSLLGGGGGGEVPEVLSTPLTQGQGEEEEDAVTMCTLPDSSSEDHDEKEDQPDSTVMTRKPRICTRKVRGARIRTPSPSPSPDRSTVRDVDPLCKAVLMIPSTPAPTFAGDLLALARQRGIF